MKEIDAEADEMEQPAQKAARKQRLGRECRRATLTTECQRRRRIRQCRSVRRSTLPRVTGVRHWSTPDYTRVAIDVEQEVKFGSQRISHPDRIFFDLRDTKLASTLVGKTFDVDDGFLKKIRVAEFQPGRTRIVLEVDDLASYDAFLLPDPYRLIIDIHGKTETGDVDGQRRTARQRPVPLRTHGGSRIRTTIPAKRLPSSSESTKTCATEVSNEIEKDAVSFAKSGAGGNRPTRRRCRGRCQAADSAKPANGIGVIKTTVAVKGSNRRIPKTIVEAEDKLRRRWPRWSTKRFVPKHSGRARRHPGADETKLREIRVLVIALAAPEEIPSTANCCCRTRPIFARRLAKRVLPRPATGR